MRTQAEILVRIASLEDTDMFGFQREVLISALTYENAKQFLNDDVTHGDWAETVGLLLTDKTLRDEAASYMMFAWGKVEDHRGISAARSVEKMRSYVWLLGDDDVLEQFDDAPYKQYGAPQLRFLCEHYHWPMPESERVRRMSEGLPCRGPEDVYGSCMDGCG